jgi:hypothetical protein
LSASEHGLLRDLVEREPVNLLLLAAQLLDEVPADRFALAVRVGRDVDVGGVLRGVLELLDDFLPRTDGFVRLLEVVVDVDAELALRQIADMAHRRHDLVVAAEVFVDGLGLCRRFDHDQCFCHYVHPSMNCQPARTGRRRPASPSPAARARRVAGESA